MKTITIILITIFCYSPAWAGREFASDNLICYGINSSTLSCVSKASIERDKLQLELINLQIQELKEKKQKKELKK